MRHPKKQAKHNDDQTCGTRKQLHRSDQFATPFSLQHFKTKQTPTTADNPKDKIKKREDCGRHEVMVLAMIMQRWQSPNTGQEYTMCFGVSIQLPLVTGNLEVEKFQHSHFQPYGTAKISIVETADVIILVCTRGLGSVFPSGHLQFSLLPFLQHHHFPS